MKMGRLLNSLAGLLGLFALLAAIPELHAQQGRPEEKRFSPNAKQGPKVDQLPKGDLQKTLPNELLLTLHVASANSSPAGGTFVINGKEFPCEQSGCIADAAVKAGSKVVITVKPNKHSVFKFWGGTGHPCSGLKVTTCSFVISTGLEKIHPVFENIQREIVVTRAAGSKANVLYYASKASTVFSVPQGTTAKFNYDSGRPLFLEVKYDPGVDEFGFEKWTGACAAAVGNICMITPETSPINIGIVEKKKVYTLEVAVAGTVAGTVYSDPPGLQCTKAGGKCSISAPVNTFVDVILSPANSNFKGVFVGAFCNNQKTENRCRFSLGGNVKTQILFEPK